MYISNNPIVIDNFITTDEINQLKELEKNSLYHKFYDPYYVTDSNLYISGKSKVVADICNRIKELLECECSIGVAYLAKIIGPLEPHTDTDWINPDKSYKRITCCFNRTNENENSGLVLFNQRNYDKPVTFSKGETVNFSSYGKLGLDYIKHNNLICTESYDFLENYNDDKPFDKEIYEKYLNHLSYNTLDGLTFDRVVEQKIGQLILFDMYQLHASESMIESQIKSQLIASFLRK